jgi:hypothetical protein
MKLDIDFHAKTWFADPLIRVYMKEDYQGLASTRGTYEAAESPISETWRPVPGTVFVPERNKKGGCRIGSRP